MTVFTTTLRRELATLWLTPHAWTLLIILLVLQGITLSSILANLAGGAESVLGSPPLEVFYGQSALVPLAYILLCPALTMRSFAEEIRSGTIDNLLSAPVGMSSVVLGKYFASLLSFLVLWFPSTAYPLILGQVTEIDWRVIAATYLGVCGLGAGFLAIGILFSALTRSQFLALVLTAGTLVMLLLLGAVGRATDNGAFRQLCEHIAMQPQLAEVSQGVISLRRVVYDATLIGFPLFVATRVAGSWRWS